MRYCLKSILYIFIAVIFVFEVVSVTGCKILTGVKSIRTEKVRPHHFQYKDKTIIFTPLVHFGNRKFYENLKDSIVNWKQDGYVIFYEQITSGQEVLGLDSVAYDALNRKFRRIDGGGDITPEAYEKDLQKVFKNGIGQPRYADLGIDSADVNADVNFLELVNKIEEVLGDIQLDSCDYATSLDSSYSCTEGTSLKLLDPIYVDYRNSVVVNKVKESNHKKIVILFGAAHRKGMTKLFEEREQGKEGK